ncbi:MAG: hypothetical protein Q7U10_12085 [Thermodesulfovibrionia bacterium]|nr:hypothetical protein [Thermodesulfovibrionia bacterium]
MPQATTLGAPGQAATFSYKGNVLEGVLIEYEYANVSIDYEFFQLILSVFRGQQVYGGFSETNPTQGGLGEWIRDNSYLNSQPLTPRHVSRIAAILVAEKYATSEREGNAVLIKFKS